MKEFNNIKKIGVISDTHIPTRAPDIPKKVFKYFNDVDLIIHSGDIEILDVIKDLEKISQVIAVQGNMDPYEVASILPSKQTIKVNDFKIGITHGYGPPDGITDRVISHFDEKLDCIIFGHTHKPFNQIINNTLLFNPGSPIDNIFADINSIGILKLNKKIEGEIIKI